MHTFLKALPIVASSAFAITLYLVVIAAWVYFGIKIRNYAELSKKIMPLQEHDKAAEIRKSMGITDMPRGLTADQYVKDCRDRLILAGVAILCCCMIIISSVAFLDAKHILASTVDTSGSEDSSGGY